MPATAITPATAANSRTARLRRFSAAGLVTASAAAALTLVPSPAQADSPDSVSASAATVSAVSLQQQADKADTADQAGKSGKAGDKKSRSEKVDVWIHEALDIMEKKDIPGSYEGLHRNIMRESAGDPHAVNDWDVNAQKGTPSKGLLQVIQPTFDAYHVDGTENDLTDPVANITAAANYAADRYGSIDNVDSAY